MEKQNDCLHEQFFAHCKVGRISETDGRPITSYTLDVTVKCTQCNMNFEFVGVPGGLDPNHPTTSFDFTELRAPIRPFTGKGQDSLRYVVRADETPKANIN